METLTALVSRFNPSVQLFPSLGNSSAVSKVETIDLLAQAKEVVKRLQDSHHKISPLEDVLDFLSKEVPKSLVNLVDSALLTVLSLPHKDQNSIRESPSKPCICFNDCSSLEGIVRRWSYQDDLEKLLASMKYNLKDDFSVVLQTSVQDASRPPSAVGWANVNSAKTPVESPGKEFAALGVGIWNNMMSPIGQKQSYHFAEIPKAKCPSQEHPYFFTYKNSNYSSFPLESQAEAVSEQRSFGTIIPCSVRDPSDTIPASVHNLRPADIKIIGALGDSLTAGNGAGSSPNDVLDVLTQYRGLSWSVGGNENISTVTTLANILREYNPRLLGFSTGKGTQDKSNAYLNQAVAGARSESVPSQARRLIDLMKTDSTINFQEDWKLITLFIGGNDLCNHCEDPVRWSPENFISNIQTALDILHKEVLKETLPVGLVEAIVPRMFVNLATILRVSTLRILYQDKRVSCPRLIMRFEIDLHSSSHSNSGKTAIGLCPCVLDPDDNSTEIEMLESFNRRYQEETHRLVNSGRYDTREDFTVVVQPLVEDISMPLTQDGLPDRSFFAPDCFHFQQKTHSQAARALWNNMLEPLGNKTNSQVLEEEITLNCPTQEQPYLMTYRNSNYTYFREAPLTYGSQMPCEDRDPSITSPTSVHNLKPADVQVIAALGDSFTAGNGIGANPNDMWNMNMQYRGLAWSIGGDALLTNVTTLSNIFREFNAKLTGYSTGIGGPSEPNAFFNQAVPEATAKDLPEQVKHLVRLMKNDLRIKFESDWKVITVFIGTHDLCNYCKDINHYSAVNFSNYVREALDILHAGVPNALVNLVEVMDLLPLRQLFLDSRLPCPTHLAE
ncbi:hypothetical protein lerEdw1_018860 [Lerista edwardsae]|nr:hypothetical protein lerEdw1_018860 [Lerista edwardsae]